MAKTAKKGGKAKKAQIEMTLWDVILSYPDLHEPKPFKGKTYYSTDVLFDKKHHDRAKLKEAITSVCEQTWGEDNSEWPMENIPVIENGNTREDADGYQDRWFIRARTQTPVPVVNLDGEKFSPKLVKGGMFANVAVTIKAWEFEGDEGVAIYLNGVQIDTDKEALNFGGGRSVKSMFSKDGDDEMDEQPRKKKRPAADEDDEEEAPRKKRRPAVDDDEDEEPAPRKKKRPAPVEDEDDDSDFDDEEEEELPRKKKRRSFRDEDDEE